MQKTDCNNHSNDMKAITTPHWLSSENKPAFYDKMPCILNACFCCQKEPIYSLTLLSFCLGVSAILLRLLATGVETWAVFCLFSGCPDTLCNIVSILIPLLGFARSVNEMVVYKTEKNTINDGALIAPASHSCLRACNCRLSTGPYKKHFRNICPQS